MPELKKLLIETPVDRLVILAKRKNGITSREAAKLLGVSEPQIEDWVRILEAHDLLKLVFPPIGEPKIVPAKFTLERLSKKVEEFRKRKVETETLAAVYEERVGEAEKRFSEKFVPLEERLYAKLKEVENYLRALRMLSAKERVLERNIAKFEKTKTLVLKETEEVESMTGKVTEKIDEARAYAQELEKELGTTFEELGKHDKEVKVLEEEQQKIEQDLAALNKEIKIVSSLAAKKPAVPLIKRLAGIIHGEGKRKKLARKRHAVHKKVLKINKKLNHHKEKFIRIKNKRIAKKPNA